ncbi:MAG: hypothetical protein ACK559_14970, partial [bacterium]
VKKNLDLSHLNSYIFECYQQFNFLCTKNSYYVPEVTGATEGRRRTETKLSSLALPGLKITPTVFKKEYTGHRFSPQFSPPSS